MKASSRLVLPLVGALVLTVAVLGTVLWPEPSVSVPVEESATPAATVQGTPASRPPTALPGKPMFSSQSPGPRAQEVERLERERNVAAARGDEAARQRLDMVIQQNRERMQEMREELESLSVQASSDLPDR
jgi:hypothetical protein